ncbi:745_t:CDS:2, partial [Funneliformis mosseae]
MVLELDAFIYELKIHLYLNYCNQIIHYLDISQDPNTTNEYLLVMQYANGGDLQNYLKNNFNNLTCYGVLMWEISSEYPPFKEFNDATICAIIINKACENTIPDTPKDYEKLYKKCWDQEPEKRPTITEILEEFSKMSFINKPIKINSNMFELINNKLNNKVKVINYDELIDLEPLDEGGFGSIIKATWSKTNNYAVCKRLTDTSIFKCDDDKLGVLVKEPEQRPIIKEVLKNFLKMGFGRKIDDETTKNIITEHTNNISDPDLQVGDSIQYVTYDELDGQDTSYDQQLDTNID